MSIAKKEHVSWTGYSHQQRVILASFPFFLQKKCACVGMGVTLNASSKQWATLLPRVHLPVSAAIYWGGVETSI